MPIVREPIGEGIVILRRIQVEGFRCFRSRVELDDLVLGTNLIHAPNETGKSSLVAAIARCLFDRYGTKGEEMLDLRPWGTHLSPQILLEVETHGKKFRVEKRFLDGAMSRLGEWTGERFEPLAEANAADELIRGFLGGTGAAKGLSDLEHWGLARLLWMPQAPARLSVPRLDGPVRERLLEVLGAASLTEREQRLIGRIEEIFATYYTPKSGQLKRGGPLALALQEKEEAAAQVAHWREQCAQAEHYTITAQTAQTRLSEAKASRVKIEAEMVGLEERAKREAETEAALQEKKQERNAIAERWKRWQSSLDDLQRLKDRIARHATEIALLEPALSLETGALGARREAVTQAASAAQESGKRLAALEWRSLRELVNKLEEIKHVGEAKAKELQSRRRPKETDIAQLRRQNEELSRARIRLEALALEVRFEAEGETREATWSADEGQSTATARPGEEIVFRGINDGELHVKGVGKLRIRSGAEDARKLHASLLALETSLHERLAEYAVEDFEALLALRESSGRLEREIDLQRTLFTATLAERYRNLDEAKRALAQMESQATLPLVEEAPFTDLGESLREARLAATQAETSARERARELQVAEKRVAELAGRKAAETKGIETLQAEMEAKIAAGGTHEVLTARRQEEALQQASVEAQLKLLESRLPSAPERAAPRLSLAREEWKSCEREEREALGKYESARALLEKAAGEGIYTKCGEAEERLALAEKVLAARERKARAAKLLRELARERHDRLNDRFAHPIQERVAAYFSCLRGNPTELSFGAQLDQLRLRNGAGEESALGAHSFGSQEQAMFAIRLALGRLLAERGAGAEPQMIVLDDPLVNTDPGRHQRALDLIRQAEDKLQILILTAFPEKYRGLAAREFDLFSLRHGNA